MSDIIAGFPEDGGWQPIATAPKDGTEVLLWAAVWDETWGVQIGRFSGGNWHTAEGSAEENGPDFDPEAEIDPDEDFDEDKNIGPTHWYRIPDPPKSFA